MKPLSLATVRQHTGCKLAYGEACTIANPHDPFLRNMLANKRRNARR